MQFWILRVRFLRLKETQGLDQAPCRSGKGLFFYTFLPAACLKPQLFSGKLLINSKNLSGEKMFQITPTALENLTSYLQENNVESAVRVALMAGGCSGQALGLALDEAKENDTTFREGSLDFLIEESLLTMCGEIKVDFIQAGSRSGFSITSTNPVGGGGCGSCTSGSCG